MGPRQGEGEAGIQGKSRAHGPGGSRNRGRKSWTPGQVGPCGRPSPWLWALGLGHSRAYREEWVREV